MIHSNHRNIQEKKKEMINLSVQNLMLSSLHSSLPCAIKDRDINAQIHPEYLCNRNLSDKFSGFYSILIPVKTHSVSACGTYCASD